MTESYMPKSKSDVHVTPDNVFEIIESKWGYTKDAMFDPCPVDPKFDGLTIDWEKINYVNPPYSKPLFEQFIDKAIAETDSDKVTIMLLPSKTDQQWFHRLIENNYEIVWIRKRLRFKNNIHHATQPHFLVIIR